MRLAWAKLGYPSFCTSGTMHNSQWACMERNGIALSFSEDFFWVKATRILHVFSSGDEVTIQKLH
jgi:hypothetical protein